MREVFGGAPRDADGDSAGVHEIDRNEGRRQQTNED
jgi:hypothetical protein